jgi:hypothetical protein
MGGLSPTGLGTSQRASPSSIIYDGPLVIDDLPVGAGPALDGRSFGGLFHDLRNKFARRLASGSVSIQVIAKALGHSTVAMSERYARPSEEAMKSILSALDSGGTKAVEGPHRTGSQQKSAADAE